MPRWTEASRWPGCCNGCRSSRERLAAIREQLPDTLRDQVRAGPLDETGWSLLVPNGAAAAKLRQLLPALQATLDACGLAGYFNPHQGSIASLARPGLRLVPAVRIERTTFRLQGGCSTN